MILFPAGVSAASVSFDIAAESGGAGANQGSFTPGSIEVESGDSVTINFSVPIDDLYCCGIQVKGNGGEFDTGTINKGAMMSVNFTAGSSFSFTSFWPGTGTPKATGNVIVNDPAPTPPAKPTNLAGTSISTTQIDITWDGANGAVSYEVYRNGNMIGTTSMLSYSDSGLSEGTSYNYKLKAVGNTDLKSGFSNVLAISTKSPPPDPSQNSNQNGNKGNKPDGSQSTVTVSPTPQAGTAQEVFTDPRYDYAAVNEVIYTFSELPEIVPGDIFKIWGRTTAFASISMLVESTPQTYSTIADENGHWVIDIDTSVLKPDLHTFTTTITKKEFTEGVKLEPVAFVVASKQTPDTFTSGSVTSETEKTITLSDQLRKYATVFMGTGGFMVATGILVFLFKRR